MHPIEKLYKGRCIETGGKYKPHFWKAQPMVRKPLTYLGNDRSPVQDDGQSLACLQRLNRLGLDLEIEVGQFITAASRKDLPSAPYLKELLMSNVADEARHFDGFTKATEAYGAADGAISSDLQARWIAAADETHPMLIAATMETGVFLVTLGLMRLIGGSELSDLAFRVAKDEARHVKLNRSLARKLGLSPDKLSKPVQELVDDTLAYAVGDLSIPLLNGLDLDFFTSQSRELIAYGTAKVLDELTAARQHVMPFEVPNASLYDRETDDGLTVY